MTIFVLRKLTYFHNVTIFKVNLTAVIISEILVTQQHLLEH